MNMVRKATIKEMMANFHRLSGFFNELFLHCIVVGQNTVGVEFMMVVKPIFKRIASLTFKYQILKII